MTTINLVEAFERTLKSLQKDEEELSRRIELVQINTKKLRSALELFDDLGVDCSCPLGKEKHCLRCQGSRRIKPIRIEAVLTDESPSDNIES